MGRPKGSKNGQLTLVAITCERCGKVFYRRPSAAKTARFCSPDCVIVPREEVQCRHCGKMYIPTWGTLGVFCSMQCYIAGRSNQETKTCKKCGKPFTVRKGHSHYYTHCPDCRRQPPKKVLKKQSRESAKIAKNCKYCGKEFFVFRNRVDEAKFCSMKCRDSMTERATIVCAYCGKEKTMLVSRIRSEHTCCSNRCANLFRLENGGLVGKMIQKRGAGIRTKSEALVENVLIDLGIAYEFEFGIGRYSADFALPELSIVLECDGWGHETAIAKKHDQERDQYLREKGWRVVRVPNKEIYKDSLAAIKKALNR